MEGTVTWPQAIWVLSVMGMALGAGFLAAWRIQILRSRDRHDVVTKFEQKMVVVAEQILEYKTNMEKRISAIEHFNAGTIVVLEHLKEFREEVKDQYQKLVEQREQDMEGLHRRLDALHNTARLERIALEDMQNKRG